MLKHKAITDGILSAFYHVYNCLGFGFLERVYENPLAYELAKRGFATVTQMPVAVWYDGVQVGEFYADLVVEQKVIVELKTQPAIVPANEAQLLNYLKATKMEVGLLLNFGPKPEFKRKVLTQETDQRVTMQSTAGQE